jgi:hypothetical protein
MEQQEIRERRQVHRTNGEEHFAQNRKTDDTRRDYGSAAAYAQEV